jgi:hypothetical protein
MGKKIVYIIAHYVTLWHIMLHNVTLWHIMLQNSCEQGVGYKTLRVRNAMPALLQNLGRVETHNYKINLNQWLLPVCWVHAIAACGCVPVFYCAANPMQLYASGG